MEPTESVRSRVNIVKKLGHFKRMCNINVFKIHKQKTLNLTKNVSFL